MLSIPEIAAQLVDKSQLQSEDKGSRTIIFVGSKSVGKSTLINYFLDKTDAPRETLVLEYSFGRKTSQKQGMEKTVCHIWEYGGKLDLLKTVLLSLPIYGQGYICVMVDLSKIKNIWSTLETAILTITETLSQNDKRLELIIVGGKYDLFKNYDSDIKKMVCNTIRSVAIIYNAHVIFYSSKEQQLMRRAKEMLFNIGFGTGLFNNKEKNTNFNKPLLVPKDTDTWESIGVPKSSVEQVKVKHLSRFPSEAELVGQNTVISTAQRLYPEPVIDSLLDVKYEELRSFEMHDISIDEYLSTLR